MAGVPALAFSFLHWLVASLVIVCFSAPPPPLIARNGIFNAAGFLPAGLSQGALARGARFRIRGTGLTGAGPASVLLAGVPAKVVSAGPRELEAIVPNAPLGEATLVVTVDGSQSEPRRIHITAAGFAIYSENGEGWGPGRVDQFDGAGRRVPNSLDHPLQPGQRLLLRGTGLGNGGPISVWIGGKAAHVASVRAGADGLAQVVVDTPRDAPQGCYVPVVTRQGAAVSNTVTIAVKTAATRCDPSPVFPFEGWLGKRSALVMLSRSVIRPLEGPSRQEDEVSAAFLRPAQSASILYGRLGRPLLAPPLGACTGYLTGNGPEISLAGSFAAMLQAALPGDGWDVAPKLALIQGSILHGIPRIPGAPGRFRSVLGNPGMPRASLAFDGGEFTVTGPDGQGPLEVHVPAPSVFECVNCRGLSEVNRTRGITLEWSGTADDSYMAIVAASADPEAFVQGSALCLVEARARRFTVPPEVLSPLPASGSSRGSLSLIAWPFKQRPIPLRGAQASLAVSLYIRSMEIRFR